MVNGCEGFWQYLNGKITEKHLDLQNLDVEFAPKEYGDNF
jgi:hypothetical protein